MKWNIFKSAILAGICIGIAGFGYLAVGGLFGATVFAFGLMAVINYKFKLYTGTAGFFKKGELCDVFLILLGNIVGTLAVALLSRASAMPIQESAQKLLEGRLTLGALKCGALAIGCGFIMTTIVKFARLGHWLMLVFGIPMFIICGFPHCIADAFYYLASPFSFLGAHIVDVLILYISIVIGNFIGCNLTRTLIPDIDK